jgi:hypothetical protein
MKMKPATLLFLFLFISSSIGISQIQNDQSMVFKPSAEFQKSKGFLDQLLDPNKLSISHSYSISYYTMGQKGYNQGLYLSTINYQFSDPLLMQVRFGYMHQPFGGTSNASQGVNNKFFVQRAMLQYQPFKNTTLVIDYQAYPSPFMNPYYRTW